MKKLNCLVTGASSGIGKEISIELSNYAKHIYICSRNVQKLEIVHDKIIENNCECTIVPLNLCDENVIENLAKFSITFSSHKFKGTIVHSQLFSIILS